MLEDVGRVRVQIRRFWLRQNDGMTEGLEGGQAFAVGLPDRAAEEDVGDAAVAFHGDESSFGQFFEMVRDGWGADDGVLLQGAAGEGVGGGDLL